MKPIIQPRNPQKRLLYLIKEAQSNKASTNILSSTNYGSSNVNTTPSAEGDFVDSICVTGETPLKSDVTLSEGLGIALTQSNNDISVAASLEINDLTDVDTSGVSDGDGLIYDLNSQTWITGAGGVSGYSGASGASGFSGVNGHPGDSGASGTNGISGYSGVSGSAGASGISGYSGVSGASENCLWDEVGTNLFPKTASNSIMLDHDAHFYWSASHSGVSGDVDLYRGEANKIYLANGNKLRLLSGILELSGISDIVTSIAGVMQIYYNTDRVYAVEPSGVVHDLTVAERQNFQIAVGNREAATTNVLVSVDTEAANGAPGHGIVIRQVVDWDFVNRHVETDYTSITFPVIYTVGPGWISAGNLAMFKSFKKTGKTARLRVRAKRDAYVGLPVPIKSFNLVVCDEGTAVNVQTQLCTLTTSWVDYTLIADLSSLGDQLQWGIEVIPQSTNTAIAESTFKFYIDDIELAQWAL